VDLLSSLDVSKIADWALAKLPAVGAALLIMLAFLVGYRLSRAPLRAVLARAGLHRKLVQLLVDSIFKYSLVAIGLVMAAAQLGIDVAAAIAGLGVVGIAVGFAAQDTLSNVISGIVVFMDKPFVVGDWITVEGNYGKVGDITLRSTRIRTPQNTWVVIPNKSIIDAVLVNHSKHGEIRIDVPVGIAYKEDITAARDAILEAVRTIDWVLEDPAPDVVVDALGSSSIDLLARVWIHNADRERATHFAVVERTKRALDAAGIQIPFPHLQLFVDSVEERVWRRIEALAPSAARGTEDAQ